MATRGNQSIAMNIVLDSAIKGVGFLQTSFGGINKYSKSVQNINLLKKTNFPVLKRNLRSLENHLGHIRSQSAKITANPIRLDIISSRNGLKEARKDMNAIAQDARTARNYNKLSYQDQFKSPVPKAKRGYIGNKIKTVGGVATVGALGALKALEPIKESLNFETSMADVQKATNTNKKQLKVLKTGIEKIIKIGLLDKEGSILNVNEIASIQTMGGKSGVKKKALPRFTQDIVLASVAMDLTPAQSATSFAKMSERMSLPIGNLNVLTNAFTRLESSGSNFAIDLIDTTGRLSGVFKDLNFKPKNSTAISNYMNTLEVSSELAASSFKILMDRFKKTDQKLGYYTKLKKGGAESLKPIIQDITKTMSTQQIIKNFGSQGMNVINNMKGNYKTLDKSLAVVGTSEQKRKYTEQYKEKLNTTHFMSSVKTEYKIKMATNQAKIIAEQNRKKLQSALMGDRLVPAYVSLLKVIPPVVEGVANFLSSSIAIYKANKPLIKTLGAVALGIIGIVLATKTVGVITGLFNPISLAIAGIAGASYLIYKNWSSIKGFFSSMWTGVKNIFKTGVGYLRTAFGYSPIGMINKNWKPISKTFEQVANLIKKPFKSLFAWVASKFEWLMNVVRSVKGALSFSNDKKTELTITEKNRVINLKKSRDNLFLDKKALDPRPINNVRYNPKTVFRKPTTLKDVLTGQEPIKKVVGGVNEFEITKLKTLDISSFGEIMPIESVSRVTDYAIQNIKKDADLNSTNNNQVTNNYTINPTITATDGIIDTESFAQQLDRALRDREYLKKDTTLSDFS